MNFECACMFAIYDGNFLIFKAEKFAKLPHILRNTHIEPTLNLRTAQSATLILNELFTVTV